MVCLKAKIQKNNTTNKIKHAKTTIKKSNLKPQSLRKKICLKTWQIRGALIGKFYDQGRLQITFHRFRACKTKKLNTI
ncbi:hypothetical protein, partial [Helicobacter pylori]|uniref:hypothetical protein n=1 Tax=Helicobacter pylori TaxID=210 RepID=UPI0030BA75FC